MTETRVQIEPDFQTEFEIDLLDEREKMRGNKEKTERRKKSAEESAGGKRGLETGRAGEEKERLLELGAVAFVV
ncbi:MAG TPA: hypothetical protein VEC43_04375 [Candidatus Acidoferrales bacterium]|nr:hypothetical protein [Candidatus Acidoferrales bacterium]